MIIGATLLFSKFINELVIRQLDILLLIKLFISLTKTKNQLKASNNRTHILLIINLFSYYLTELKTYTTSKKIKRPTQ